MPNNINILVGKVSQFWFVSDYSQLTRKGRMTSSQKRKNKVIKKLVNIGKLTIYESFEQIVRRVLELQSTAPRGPVTLYTDEHPQYKKGHGYPLLSGKTLPEACEDQLEAGKDGQEPSVQCELYRQRDSKR